MSEDLKPVDAPEIGGAREVVSRRYASYVLGVLFLAYVFNFIDRQILASTVLFFVLNLIGMGLGPQAIGILNDRHRAPRSVDG